MQVVSSSNIGFHLFTASYRVKVACKVDTACSPSITTPYLSNYKRCLRLPDMHYLPCLFYMQVMEFNISCLFIIGCMLEAASACDGSACLPACLLVLLLLPLFPTILNHSLFINYMHKRCATFAEPKTVK